MKDTITREQFEKGNFGRYNKTSRGLVVALLRDSKDTGFTVKGIAKRINVGESTIRGYLRNLRKSGDVSYKIPFFIWREKSVKAKKVKKVEKKPVRRKTSSRRRKIKGFT